MWAITIDSFFNETFTTSFTLIKFSTGYVMTIHVHVGSHEIEFVIHEFFLL